MEPILLDVPDELLTERLHLRIPRLGDGPAIAEAVIASRPELQPFMPWATEAYNTNDAEMWVRRSLAKFILREQITYEIRLRDTDQFIGGIGPHDIHWKIRKCEIGYWLHSGRTGNGYMTEALNAVTNLCASIGMRRIEVRCDTANAKSAAVPPRCGFEREGTLRSDALDTGGRPRSTIVFSKIFEDREASSD